MARKLKDDKWNALFDYLVFYGSYLWLPALVILFQFWQLGQLSTAWFVVAGTVILICMYARFVEPRWLRVNQAEIDLTPPGYDGPVTRVKAAVFSDTHFGIFRNVMPLRRLRQSIECEEADFVLVAGDLTNHLRKDELDGAFREFEKFEIPVFAVLGNHDHGLPGWIMPQNVAECLARFGVKVLENETVQVAVAGVTLTITGLKDHYAGTADYALLLPDSNRGEEGAENVPHLVPAPHLVIAHNADAAHDYPHGAVADLTVSGHTHGGQIRLPFIYRRFIPTRHGFNQGLYLENGFKVYISSGTGMDLLPARLGIPPSLDILTLVVACPKPSSPAADISHGEGVQ